MSQPLSRLMGRAAFWSGLNSALLRLGQFGIGIAVARLVAPHQFGVFAVALTVQTVIVNVSELNVSAALIRAQGDVARVGRTVALLALVSSTLLCGLMVLTAPGLATLLGAREATDAIRVLSITVLIGGLTSVPYAILVREFRQRTRFVADTANLLVSSVVVILLALEGSGAMALAISRVAGQLASLVLLFALVRPLYRPGWDREEAGRVLRFSVPLAGADVIAFVLANVDYIVIGRTLGALPLGFYVLAFNVAGWPVSVLGLMIDEVALPAFAHTRADKAGLPARCRDALRLVALVAFPVSALIFALARPLVLTVYGEKWLEAAVVLSVLGLFGAVRIMVSLMTNVLAALGHSRSVLVAQAVAILTLTPALVVAVQSHGIVGAAVAQELVGVLVVIPILLVLVSRAGGGGVLALARPLLVPLAGAVLTGAIAFGAAEALVALGSGSPVQLVVAGLLGAVAYLALFGRQLRRSVARIRSQYDQQDEPTAFSAGLPPTGATP